MQNTTNGLETIIGGGYFGSNDPTDILNHIEEKARKECPWIFEDEDNIQQPMVRKHRGL